jgi:hypothetical protein
LLSKIDNLFALKQTTLLNFLQRVSVTDKNFFFFLSHVSILHSWWFEKCFMRLKSNGSFVSVVSGSSAPTFKQTQAFVATAEAEEAVMYIYTASQSDIPKILRDIDSLVKDKFIRQEIQDDILLTLEPNEVGKL